MTMLRSNMNFFLRGALVLCLILMSNGLVFAQTSGDAEVRVVSSPEDLRDELQWLQFCLSDGGDGMGALRSGYYMFVPDDTTESHAFAEALPWVYGVLSDLSCVVMFYEDAVTSETVFLDEKGDEIWRLPAVYDHDYHRLSGGGQGNDSAADSQGRNAAGVTMLATLVSYAWVPSFYSFSSEIRDPGGLGEDRDIGTKPQTKPIGAAAKDLGVQSATSLQSEEALLPVAKTVAQDVSAGAILYADSDIGSSQYDGLSPSVLSTECGPALTVQQALDSAVSGDVVELRGGAAFSDGVLSPGDKHIVLRPVGNVRF